MCGICHGTEQKPPLESFMQAGTELGVMKAGDICTSGPLVKSRPSVIGDCIPKRGATRAKPQSWRAVQSGTEVSMVASMMDHVASP